MILLIVACLLAGCEDGGAGRNQASELPPGLPRLLRATFEPRFEPLGLRLTRASVVDLDTGPHLQLYVEPPGPYTSEQYLQTLVSSVAAVAPWSFEQWEGLASIDVCQEPPPAESTGQYPEPVTVVVLTRQQSASIDWDSAEIADLRAAVRGAAFGTVEVSAEVEPLLNQP